MANHALYSKYRPICFKDMFGEDHIVKSLTNAIAKKQIAHAYIFHGPRGVGKTTAAKLFAKTINCESLQSGDACNKCKNCNLINANQTMDIIELDAASNNGVAEIRNLIDNVNYLPADLRTKVYILDEAHMLSNSSWNALLKTIEECPDHAAFVFATTEFHKIPLTILSRCQCFGFKPFTEDVLVALITNISELEKIKIDPEAIQKIAVLAKGAARDAITLLDQIKNYATRGKITEANINEIFGLLDEKKKIAFVDLIFGRDLQKAIDLIDELEFSGINLNLFINDVFGMLIDVYLYAKYRNGQLLRTISAKNVAAMKLPEPDEILRLTEIWEDLVSRAHFTSNIKYNLQLAVFRSVKPDFRATPPQTSIARQKETAARPEREEPRAAAKKPPEPAQPPKPEPAPEKEDASPAFASEADRDGFVRAAFFAIAKNYDAKLHEKYAAVLSALKEESGASNAAEMFLRAKKVLLASPGGIVLLYDSPDDALFVNNLAYDARLHEFVADRFQTPLVFVAVTKKAGKQHSDAFAELKDKSKIPELDTERIKALSKPSDKTREFAESLFGKDLKYE